MEGCETRILGVPQRNLSIQEKGLEFSLRCSHLEKRREQAPGGEHGSGKGHQELEGLVLLYGYNDQSNMVGKAVTVSRISVTDEAWSTSWYVKN